ncbi:MAG TPA: sigma-54 dependent transcriptional regulator [Planctomycetota bacterium]|nr:sigma-54 dependent transcriptional regulator [Planctomycetota bacterium]
MESGSDIAKVNTAPSSDAELLLQSWAAGPSSGEEDGPVFHAISAVSLLAAADEAPAEAGSAGPVLSSALGLLIGLLRAERAFLFQVDATEGPPGLGAIGAPLASRDLDGESIQQPERKVPRARLIEAAHGRQPVLLAQPEGAIDPRAAAEGRGPSLHAAVFPVENQKGVAAVLYIENRFQPLDATRETVWLTRSYCKVLGVILELEMLRRENKTLWSDVENLRHTKVTAQEILAVGGLVHPRSHRPARKPGELKGDYSFITGSSPKMLEIFQLLDKIASSNAPVLINGESGTGKELVANAVHHNSPRRGKTFVSENCGALTETLLESELFGYVKGAFTGAGKDHKGLFELAEGGTLFLDEVGDMSSGMQKKLLRVLQEGVIRRVGGKDYIPVDVRIISATNKDLMEEVRSGNFREDLYYRLNVINLKLPPLRERKEDIPELIESFLEALGAETGIPKKIEHAAVQKLVQYNWPGNIRELKNEMKRLYTLSDSEILIHDVSDGILRGEGGDALFSHLERDLSSLTLKDATERVEREMIRSALIQCRGNKSLMAKMLQVPKTSLYNKINKYGFDKA